MCTVTVLPMRRGQWPLRVWCNRDERRDRPPALPPEVHPAGPNRAILPVDPVSSGTWIAANNAGLVATLLNVNLRPDDYERLPGVGLPHRSRGLIIPPLMQFDTVERALDAVALLTPTDYAPFRLIVINRTHYGDVYSDGRSFAFDRQPLEDDPLMFTSSGLGDHLVEEPRRRLFDRYFEEPVSTWTEQQAAFHRHVWPDNPELSVCMSRPDAKTVSLTAVEVSGTEVRLRYHPAPPNDPAEDAVVAINLHGQS